MVSEEHAIQELAAENAKLKEELEATKRELVEARRKLEEARQEFTIDDYSEICTFIPIAF